MSNIDRLSWISLCWNLVPSFKVNVKRVPEDIAPFPSLLLSNGEEW